MAPLKDAVKNDKLKDFIKERSKEEKKGDKEKFDKTINLFHQLRQKFLNHQRRKILN